MQTVSWLPRIIRGKPELLWPVAWVDEVGVVTGAVALLGVTVVLAAAAVAGVSPRLCRGLAAVGFAMLVALDCSFGKITHHWHAWFFTGFVLALSDTEPAPLGVRRRLHVQRNLTVFWFAQALVLLFYSLTGFWKLVGLVIQGSAGSLTYLSPGALATQIAHASLVSGASPLAAPWVAVHPALAWLGVVGVLYLEVCAFVVAFRPALQPAWAAALIGFHLGVRVTMDLDFTGQAVTVALLFLRSPLAAGRPPIEALQGVPLVAPVARWLSARIGPASAVR